MSKRRNIICWGKLIMKFKRMLTPLSVSLTVLFSASPVLAQTNDGESKLEMEEIIVTANRREMSLQDVPMAVTVISPDDYKSKGLSGIREILDYTPGVNFNDGGAPGTGTISARGIPQSEATPVFGIYLDDTPLQSNTAFTTSAAVFLDAALFDIERIEIIKGPQGTLFGASSVGGLMRYITRDPSTDELRGHVSAEVNTTENGEQGQKYTGRVSVPIIEDVLGITISANQEHIGGYVDYVDGAGGLIEEDVDGGTVDGYAVDVLFQPNEEFRFRLKYLTQSSEIRSSSNVNLAGIDNVDLLFGEEPATVNEPGLSSIDFDVASATLSYDFGGATLTSTTSYTKFATSSQTDLTAAYAGIVDFYSGSAPGTTTSVDFIATSGAKKIVQEVRLSSAKTEKFDWSIGGLYQKEETNNTQEAPTVPEFDLFTAAFPSEYEEYAAFAESTYYFNEKFDVTAGIRISKNQNILDFTSHGLLIGTTNLEGQTLEDTVETYLLAARYRVNEDLSLYTRVASGYRPAQGNLAIIDPATGEDLAPKVLFADEAWSSEVGVKGSFLDGMGSFDFALWHIDWQDFQASLVFNGVSTGGNVEDGLTAYGFESSVTLRPADGLTLSGNLTYTKSTLDSDEPTIGAVKGEDYPNLPNWKASAQWDYIFDVSGDWTGNLGGGVRYRGDQHSSFSQAGGVVDVEIDSYVLADMNVGITNGTYNVNLYVTNLFDSDDLVGRGDNIIGAAVDSTGNLVRPRVIGANVRYNF